MCYVVQTCLDFLCRRTWSHSCFIPNWIRGKKTRAYASYVAYEGISALVSGPAWSHCLVLYLMHMVQVNLCQKLLFLHQLTHNMIVHWITSSIHENSKLKPGENMLCAEIVSDIQNNFCTHVLQKEELLTKIYLYTPLWAELLSLLDLIWYV